MQQLYDLSAAKKPTNLSINSDLLKKAKELDINLSAALEQKLIDMVKQQQSIAWLSSNQKSIANYNERVENYGVFGEDLRSF